MAECRNMSVSFRLNSRPIQIRDWVRLSGKCYISASIKVSVISMAARISPSVVVHDQPYYHMVIPNKMPVSSSING